MDKINPLQPSPDALKRLLDDVTTALTQADYMRKSMVFGSFARGTWDRWSDIDLLVVTETRPQFLDVLKQIEAFRPILHRNHFVAHVEPAGGHVLGITFQGESVFHCIDLNLLTVQEYQNADALERFGVIKTLYTSDQPMSGEVVDENGVESEIEDTPEARIKVAVHFTKKAVKKVLRGDSNLDDLRQRAAALQQVMVDYPADLVIKGDT
jgi:predicted nucleotidyltransferase